MDLNYYHEHHIFIDSIRKFIQTELDPHLNKWEKDGLYPDDVFKKLGEQGFLGILIPEEEGGIGGDYRMAGAWAEAFGEIRATGLSIGVNMHSLVITPAICKHGSAEIKKRWLEKSLAGEAIGAYAFTEPGAGSDLAQITTRAVKQGNKWIIDGAKTFITNGARADYILVLTRTDKSAGYKGFTTFVVDTSLPGFKVQRTLDKLGWHSSDTAEMTFEKVEVDESAVLGEVGGGWKQAMNNLNWERLMLTLAAIGGGRACLRDAIRYTNERKAFGDYIKEFGAVSAMLQAMYSKLKLGEALTHHALDQLCAGEDAKLSTTLAKRIVCEEMIVLADRAIQIHGGYGYTTEFSAERWWRDLRLMTLGGGTSEIMGNVIAKEMGL